MLIRVSGVIPASVAGKAEDDRLTQASPRINNYNMLISQIPHPSSQVLCSIRSMRNLCILY